MPKPKENAEAPKTGSMRRIVSHDDKPDFWKPVKAGEILYGKLIAERIGGKGPVLSIKDFSGNVRAFGVPTQLRNVDWSEFVQKDVKITYVKSVASGKGNPAKLFDVDIVE
jgi:hypothetical protein